MDLVNIKIRYLAVVIILIMVAGCTNREFSVNESQNDAVGLHVNSVGVNYSAAAVFPDEKLDLDKLIDFAYENSPELKSLYSSWLAAKERAPQEASLPDPRFSYDYFIEPVQTKTGPQDQRVGVTQTLPWLGKLSLKEKIALKQAQAVYQEYETARRRIAAEIRKSYYEYSWLHEAINITREHINLLKAVESVAAIRFKAGKISQSSLVQIQVEQGRIEDRTNELEDLKLPVSASIYSLLGLENGPLFSSPPFMEEETVALDVSELKQQLVSNNPQLERLRLLRESGDLSVKLAEKNYYPDLTFGLSFIDIDGGDDPALAHVSFNLPIWRKSLDAAKREASERRQSTEEQLLNVRNRLYAELELSLYHYRNAERKRVLYANTLVPKAKQAIDLAVKAFETGRGGFSEVLEAERTLLEFKLEAARYLADSFRRRAEIEALAGDKKDGG